MPTRPIKRAVVILQLQYPTLSLGTTFRSEQLKEILEKEGYHVVFIPDDYVGSWGFISKYGKRLLYSRVGSLVLFMGLGGFGFMWNLLGARIRRKVNLSMPLAVIVETAATGVLLSGVLEHLGVPLIIDVEEIWEEELPIEWSILKDLLSFRVHSLLRKSYKVLVPNDLAQHYLVQRFQVSPVKIVEVPLCSTRVLSSARLRSRPPRVVYAGQLSREKNGMLFVESVPLVVARHPETEFYVTNSGDLVPELKFIAKKYRAKLKLFFYEDYDSSALLSEIAASSVGVLTLPYNDSYRIFPSAKFIMYCAAGIPTVANNIGGWCSIITKERIGLLTNNSPKEFAEALMKFIDDPSLSLAFGTRAQMYLRKICDMQALGKKLTGILGGYRCQL